MGRTFPLILLRVYKAAEAHCVGCVLASGGWGGGAECTRSVVFKQRFGVQANPRRVAKVTKLIEREIGSLMQSDNVLMDITKPKSTGSDMPGALCSCTGVHVTSDLQVVKVYVSILTDDDEAKQHTVARLTGLSGCAADLAMKRISSECLLSHLRLLTMI